MRTAAICLGLALSGLDGARAETVLRQSTFDVAGPSEVVAVVDAACEGCLWSKKGREAAVLVLSVDGRYAQHLVLVQGEGPAEYRVALGAQPPGRHTLTIALDPEASAPGVGWTTVAEVRVLVTPEGAGEHAALAHAPILHARPNAVGRFSDVPLLMWYETESTPRGSRIRYSVVFSNEDGGTSPDRLMAAWGRVTDIEFVYGVELDGFGRVLEEQHQGPEHKILPFSGAHEARHPLLWVATDDNILSDHGETTLRYAPAPFAFGLVGVSREAVMDAHPWTYRVMAYEVAREDRIVQNARPGSGRIPSPQRFAYVEACGDLEGATLAFDLGVRRKDGRVKWYPSDGGRSAFRIDRSGCFRAAVAVPAGTTPERLKALRFRTYARPPREGDSPSGAGKAHLTHVNRLFFLGSDLTPGPNLFSWLGEADLRPGGPPLELPLGHAP